MSSFEAPSSEEPTPLILSFALPQQPPAWTPALMAPIVARMANLDSVEGAMLLIREIRFYFHNLRKRALYNNLF